MALAYARQDFSWGNEKIKKRKLWEVWSGNNNEAAGYAAGTGRFFEWVM